MFLLFYHNDGPSYPLWSEFFGEDFSGTPITANNPNFATQSNMYFDTCQFHDLTQNPIRLIDFSTFSLQNVKKILHTKCIFNNISMTHQSAPNDGYGAYGAGIYVHGKYSTVQHKFCGVKCWSENDGQFSYIFIKFPADVLNYMLEGSVTLHKIQRDKGSYESYFKGGKQYIGNTNYSNNDIKIGEGFYLSDPSMNECSVNYTAIIGSKSESFIAILGESSMCYMDYFNMINNKLTRSRSFITCVNTTIRHSIFYNNLASHPSVKAFVFQSRGNVNVYDSYFDNITITSTYASTVGFQNVNQTFKIKEKSNLITFECYRFDVSIDDGSKTNDDETLLVDNVNVNTKEFAYGLLLLMGSTA